MFFSRNQIAKAVLLVAVFLGTSGNQSAMSQNEESNKPKVIQFFANWAEPCRRFQPVVDQVRSQFSQEVEFVNVNVDDPNNKEIVERYGVCPIPTLVFVDSKDQVTGYSVGLTVERNITKNIQKLLPQTASNLNHSNLN